MWLLMTYWFEIITEVQFHETYQLYNSNNRGCHVRTDLPGSWPAAVLCRFPP